MRVVDTIDLTCHLSRMFRQVCALIWLFAFFSNSSPVAAEESTAHVFCRMSWASQPDQMTDCVNAQIDGARSVIRWLDWAKTSGDPAALHILSTFEACSLRWNPDYQQIDACLRAGSPLSPPEN